jgi:hypothetical protein
MYKKVGHCQYVILTFEDVLSVLTNYSYGKHYIFDAVILKYKRIQDAKSATKSICFKHLILFTK